LRRLANNADRIEWDKKPWLVLGKGPTIDRYGSIDVSRYNVMALNHAVALGPCQIAHAIDLEPVEQCSDWIEKNARYLFMPDRPHVKMTRGPEIEEHFARVPLLKRWSEEGRLVVYTKYVASARIAPPGVVPVLYFSGEAAFGILAAMGVKEVATLGIDGGTQYGRAFAALKPLTNGRQSFDQHIAAIYDILAVNKMTWTPLFEGEPRAKAR
jgi:hypothetical protein